jgi:hypothetical protein
MICTSEDARGGDWGGTPPLVWVVLAPPAFWFDPTAVVEALLLTGWCSWTFEMSLKASCSRPLVMVVRFWVGG